MSDSCTYTHTHHFLLHLYENPERFNSNCAHSDSASGPSSVPFSLVVMMVGLINAGADGFVNACIAGLISASSSGDEAMLE